MASPGDLSFGLLENYKLDLESDLDSEFDPNSDDESAEGMKPTVTNLMAHPRGRTDWGAA